MNRPPDDGPHRLADALPRDPETARRRRRCGRLASACTALALLGQGAAASADAAGSIPDTIATAAGFEAAIRATLEYHPSLAAQRARIEVRDHGVAAAKALRLPSLGARLGRGLGDGLRGGLGDGPGRGLRPDLGRDDELIATLRVRQPVWSFGRIGREIDYARADRNTERAGALALRRDLAERAGIAYARALGARRRLAASERDADTLLELVEQVRRRADASLASSADVALAEARLAQMVATRRRLATDLVLADAELLALTQVPVPVGAPVPARYAVDDSLAELEAQALGTAPVLLRGERRVALARADAARARALALPTVYLEGRTDFGDDEDDDPTFGIVVESGLDGLGLTSLARGRAADAGGRAAEAELALARTELSRRVRALHAGRNAQRALTDGFAASIERLDAALASYRRQYDAGRKDWLELLNLYREVAELRLQLERARTDAAADGIALAATTGRLDAFPATQERP